MGKKKPRGKRPAIPWASEWPDAERRSRLLHRQGWRCARCRGVPTGELVIVGERVIHAKCQEAT